MSAAVFLHEIGHHAIGFNTYKPRCLEEYHAWAWSLAARQEHGLNITDAVRHRMHLSLWYAVQKAQRRGIKAVPPELTPFLAAPGLPDAGNEWRQSGTGYTWASPGDWRSWLARMHDTHEVTGSNPVSPTSMPAQPQGERDEP